MHQIGCHLLIAIAILAGSIHALKNAVRGKKCAQNQVINKLTVYEDGAIEAECGPLPCGATGMCSEDLSSCKAASEVFSGMKWARNGQSLLLRCCSLQATNKVYIGTDLVTLGSYYTGGVVPEKDMMGNGGQEFDFVANARTEQGGVRVWVYRIVCPMLGSQPRQQQKQQPQVPHQQISAKEQPQPVEGEQPKFAEAQDAQAESENRQEAAAESGPMEEEAPNPLQYRPKRNRQTGTEPVNRVL